MIRDSDDSDFCSPKPSISLPAAPRRPEKKGSVQSIPLISLPSSSLSSDEVKTEYCSEFKTSPLSDTCAICSKNLKHLNDTRKVAHVNKCLDAQESKINHKKAVEKWSSTIDCPMCGEPQPPGPHRSAHAKRCGKTYNIPPKDLLKLMDTQSRLSEAKKRASMVHTKAPAPVKKEVAPPKLHGAPKSVFDESIQLAKAISASMATDSTDDRIYNPKQDSPPKFTRLVDPNEKRRKRPRSFAIVELAPRSCKCEVLEKVHRRFLEAFKVRNTKGGTESHSVVCRRRYERTSALVQYQTQLLAKLERLERLSEDLSHLFDNEMTTDIQINCQDGSLKGHRALLQARTSILRKSSSQNSISSVDIDETKKVVSAWLQYVYSGKIEWPTEDVESIQKLAEQYGPDDLAPLCMRMRAPAPSCTTSPLDSEPISISSSSTSKELKEEEPIKEPKTTSTESSQSAVADIIVPEVLRVDLNEPGTATDVESNRTVDLEDPLQGIFLPDTSENSSAGCTIIDDDIVTIDGEVCASNDTEKAPNVVISPSASKKEEMALSAEEASDNMLITMIDMPEMNSSHLSTPSKSPDLFDEKSREANMDVANVADDFSWDLTPLRAPGGAGSRNCSARQSLKGKGLRLTTTNEPDDDLEILESAAAPIAAMATISENVQPQEDPAELTSAGNHSQTQPPENSYGNEYFNYHDPFMEDWYEPVEMSQSSVSQSLRKEKEPRKDHPGSPIHERSITRRGSKILADTDSFFEDQPVNDPNYVNNAGSKNSFIESRDFAQPLAQSTPAQPARKKARFGSNVKILKTSNITPMPNYDRMTEEELKRELTKFGLKPMGRKRAVTMLKRIYDEIHPVIDPFTPTVRPLVVGKSGSDTPLASRPQNAKKTKSRSKGVPVNIEEEDVTSCIPVSSSNEVEVAQEADPEDEDFADLGDRTLNEPRNEPPEESMIDDTGILPKDLEGMTRTFLAWLRRPENDNLYNHLLSLQPVLIDELHLRMSRADSAVCCIPKKALANVLDRLGVTFSLPQGFGGRRANGQRKAGK